MKKRKLEPFFVYTATFALIGALFFAAGVYAKRSQAKLAQIRSESMNGAVEANNGGTKVKICCVFTQPLTDILKLPGSVEAYEDIDLAVKMAGTIEWIGPKEGDRVKKGDNLLQLDVALIKARVRRAQTNFELAQAKFKRMENLLAQNVTSQDAYDEANTNMKSAAAALDEAKVSQDYGTLVSPIDGVVDRRYVDRGEHVESGDTVMKIVDIDRVKVWFDVPEKDVLYFKRGAKVSMKGFGFFSSSPEGAERQFTGTVQYVAVTAEKASRTYPLEVVVDNSEGLLRPGMILRASLVRRDIPEGIAVPFFTIVEREDGKAVFLAVDGVAKETPIEYGMFQGVLVEIVKGLKVGDAVIVVGQRDLVNGEKIHVSQDLTAAAQAYIAAGGDLAKFKME